MKNLVSPGPTAFVNQDNCKRGLKVNWKNPLNNDRDSAAHSVSEIWQYPQAPGMDEEGSEEYRQILCIDGCAVSLHFKLASSFQLHIVERIHVISKAFLYLVTAIPKCFPPSVLWGHHQAAETPVNQLFVRSGFRVGKEKVPSQAVVHFTEKENTRQKGKKCSQWRTPEAGAQSITFITLPHHLLKEN